MKYRILILLALVFGIVPLAQAETTGFKISSELPDTLFAGSDSYVLITIENEGTVDIDHVYITLEDIDNPVVIEDLGEFRYLAGLEGSGTKQTVYKITVPEDTPAGTYLARFKITQGSASTQEKTSIHNALITVKGTSDLVIDSVLPKSIPPGKEAELSFTIKNNGNTKLTNIELSWSTPDDAILPLERDQKTYIQILNPGEEVEISTPVISKSSIEPDVYPITFNSSYYMMGEKGTLVSTVGMVIGGETDFGVSAQETSTGSLAVTVANIGTNPAYAVSVKVGQIESFIGSIDPSDYSIANIIMQSSGDQSFTRDVQMEEHMPMQTEERSYTRTHDSGTAKVQISYTDTMGERHSIVKEVNLVQSIQTSRMHQADAASQGQSSGNNLYLAGAAVLLIVGIYFRKRRKTEP